MNKQRKGLQVISILLLLQANAHAAGNSYTLPLTLAVEAASETVRSCEALGYNVSVAFVDMSGQPKVQLKSDKSTPHTFETAYRKAYTIVTFGPNYHLETSGQVAELMSKNPAFYNAVLTIPNVTPLPGALAIKVQGNIIGAIGVSGAPGGDKDEACAQAGIDKISSRLPE
ncbi:MULTISPECIES: GlcG/HbpS family heme-binding protein [Methylomonas]|uniref:Heme-binding protein n=1 Tax=Methylomonas koyamae TaxID=702114 RepID=A0A177N9L5_9GAMM|nr:heme-binding protein [Methylomonas koyamae]OAI14736.1 hypothetical protein A1355_12320 [Methylomonas koyamae]